MSALQPADHALSNLRQVAATRTGECTNCNGPQTKRHVVLTQEPALVFRELWLADLPCMITHNPYAMNRIMQEFLLKRMCM